MTVKAWQIQLKPFEGPAEENGRWMASKSIDGHIIGITRRSHLTEEAALAAFTPWSDAEPLNKE